MVKRLAFVLLILAVLLLACIDPPTYDARATATVSAQAEATLWKQDLLATVEAMPLPTLRR